MYCVFRNQTAVADLEILNQLKIPLVPAPHTVEILTLLILLVQQGATTLKQLLQLPKATKEEAERGNLLQNHLVQVNSYFADLTMHDPSNLRSLQAQFSMKV